MSAFESEEDEDEFINLLIPAFNQIATAFCFKPRMKSHGGSKKGKKQNKLRDFDAAFHRFCQDYLDDDAVYSSLDFQRRYRVPKELFLQINRDLQNIDPYFRRRPDATGYMGIHPMMKVAASLKVLSYGTSFDAQDEYCSLSETAVSESLDHFCAGIIKLYSKYLKCPDIQELAAIMEENSARLCPGLIGSLDCMAWEWKNCPLAHRGQYQGKEGVSTISLEAVCNRNLYIIHSYVGIAGSNNDINTLDRSPILRNLFWNKACTSFVHISFLLFRFFIYFILFLLFYFILCFER